MKRFFSAGLLLLSLFITVNPALARKCNGSFEIVFLHVNDMHAKIDNMGKLAYLADSIRSVHPYVFLVSSGDNFTGNPIVDMFPGKGYPMIDLMNQVGFDLSAMGNHEFDLGQEVLNKRRKEADFPFICANMDVRGSKLRKAKPYVLLKVNKCKIPVLGLIQLGENGYPDSHPSKLENLKFSPAEVKASEYMYLKDKYGFLITLTHLGIEGDVPLAGLYPQIDLIIGGHSHTVMNVPLVENGVMIVQTGSQLRSVGKTILEINKGKVTGRKYELIDLNTIRKVRPDVQLAIDRYNDNEEMNRVIAEAVSPMTGKHELGSMMTDAITHRFNTDFAFQNGGGIRIPLLPKGNIHYKDVFRLDPFGNQVVIYTMTLPEIRSLLMGSYNSNKEIDLYVSGMKYHAIVDETGNCTDVEMTDYSGMPLDPEKRYKVGMSSYIGATYRFDHADPGTTSSETTAQTLIDYLNEVKTVNYEGTRRVEIKNKP